MYCSPLRFYSPLYLILCEKFFFSMLVVVFFGLKQLIYSYLLISYKVYDRGAKKTALQQAKNSGNPQQKNTKRCAAETVAIEHSRQEQSRDRDQHQTSENHQKNTQKKNI